MSIKAKILALATATLATIGALAQVINPSPPSTATAGTGLSQAGSVLSVKYGTTAGTAVQGNQVVLPAQGGTGQASLTAFNVLLGNGTSNVAFAPPAAASSVLMSNGASANPTFQTLNSIFASPPPIGSTTPNTGTFTTISAGYTASPGGTTRDLYSHLQDSKSVKDYGAKGDALKVTGNLTTTSGNASITLTGAAFVAGDVGKTIIVPGAGASGAAIVTTIATFTSSTQVSMAVNASTTQSAVASGVLYGTDDTAAIQSAINNATFVYMPAGNYMSGTVTGVNNSHVYGAGMNLTTIFQKNVSVNGYGWFTIDTNSSSVFYDGVVISDLTVYGASDMIGFSQFVHGISINGVTNAVISHVKFSGFRGDGLYIGAGNSSNTHNYNVGVKNCVFDGINFTNRNGISIIDGSDITIESNQFVNLSQASMPGAIDVEPDAGNAIVQNIVVTKNRFDTVHGGVATVGVSLGGFTYTVQPAGFVFTENVVTNSTSSAFQFLNTFASGVTESTLPYGIRIERNTVVNSALPFSIINAKDAIVANNSFTSNSQSANVGLSGAAYNNLDVSILNNQFFQVGSSSGACVSVFTGKRLNFEGNQFNDCGSVSGYGIDFNTGTSASVYLRNNTFIAPTGKMTVAIQKEAGHTFTANTNAFNGNLYAGLSQFFQFAGSTAAVPMFVTYGAAYTPVAFGQSTAGTATYTNQQGYYSQIGNVISFTISVTYSGHTGTGQLAFTLPVNPASTGANFVAVSGWQTATSLAAGAQPAFLISQANNVIQVYTSNTGALTAESVPASGTFYISGSYLTN